MSEEGPGRRRSVRLAKLGRHQQGEGEQHSKRAKKNTKLAERKGASNANGASTAQHQGDVGQHKVDHGKQRCFGHSSELYRHYHDNIWGRPIHDNSRELFAWLCLEMMACGLTWRTVLIKEKGMRDAFSNFDVHHCASLSDTHIKDLLQDERIIRNRAKVHAIRHNARLVKDMEAASPGAFARYVWSFQPRRDKERLLASGKMLKSHMRTDFKTKAKDRKESDGVHPTTTVADMTKDMRQRGFKFMGETTVLSFMQAVGIVNHHAHHCFAFSEIEQSTATTVKAAAGFRERTSPTTTAAATTTTPS